MPVSGKAVALAAASEGSVLLAGLAQRPAPGGPSPDGKNLFFGYVAAR